MSQSLSTSAAMVTNEWHLQGKRAAVVSYSFYPGDPRPRRAAEALIDAGMAVDVICVAEDGCVPRTDTFNGVNILRIPIQRSRRSAFGYLGRYAAFVLCALAILARRSLTRRYDLVHTHNMPDIVAFSALVPKLLGAKVILDLHDPMPELMMTISNLEADAWRVRLLQRLEKWSIRFSDAVLTVNHACKAIFGSRSCRPDKIAVIMNSPDDKLFPFRSVADLAARPRGQRFTIMYHGTLVDRNGLDLAVEALAQARRSIPQAELCIYGHRTPFLDQALEAVRARGLNEAVHYCGPQRLEDLAALIDASDLGVIPNRPSVFSRLNTPTRIFEYLARGKPVIAPRARGIQDYFDDRSLIFFELGNAGDLARKIEYVEANPDEVVEITKRGQAVYLAHTWDQERLTFLNCVRALLSATVGA